MTTTTASANTAQLLITAAKAAGGTIVTDTTPTLAQALTAGNLDFTVEQDQVHATHPDTGTSILMPNHTAVIAVDRDGNRTPLSVMGTRYRPVDNATAFEFGQTLIDDDEATIIAAANYGNPVGVRSFIAFNLNRALLVNDIDVYDMYVLITNSFDGSCPVTARVIPIHRSTGATIETAIPGSPQEFVIRHSGNIGSKFTDAANVMRTVEDWALAYERMTSDMLATSFTRANMNDLANELLRTPKGAGDKSALEWAQRRLALIELFAQADKRHLHGPNTVYAAFNAVCEFCDFHAPTRPSDGDPTKVRADRFLMGESAKMKKKAWKWIANHMA